MKISTTTIIDFIESENIKYKWLGEKKESYTIASIFNLVDNGFYFFTGVNFEFGIEDALVLTNYTPEIIPNNNSFLVIEDKDVQQIYYLLLNKHYGRKSNGIIDKLTQISKEAKIGVNVQIDAFSKIGTCIIGDNCIIGSNVIIENGAIIEDNVTIESHSIIGTQGIAWTWNEAETEKIVQPQLGGVTIGKNTFLGANTIVVRGSLNENTIIGENCLFAPGARIGHGTKIGNQVHFANNVVTGGNCVIGDFAFIGSSTVFRPKVKIHPTTIVGIGAVVVKNTSKENLTLMGVPAKEFATKNSPAGMPKPKKI